MRERERERGGGEERERGGRKSERERDLMINIIKKKFINMKHIFNTTK